MTNIEHPSTACASGSYGKECRASCLCSHHSLHCHPVHGRFFHVLFCSLLFFFCFLLFFFCFLLFSLVLYCSLLFSFVLFCFLLFFFVLFCSLLFLFVFLCFFMFFLGFKCFFVLSCSQMFINFEFIPLFLLVHFFSKLIYVNE